jgi:chemotaxis protein histidine kinase CheA
MANIAFNDAMQYINGFNANPIENFVVPAQLGGFFPSDEDREDVENADRIRAQNTGAVQAAVAAIEAKTKAINAQLALDKAKLDPPTTAFRSLTEPSIQTLEARVEAADEVARVEQGKANEALAEVDAEARQAAAVAASAAASAALENIRAVAPKNEDGDAAIRAAEQIETEALAAKQAADRAAVEEAERVARGAAEYNAQEAVRLAAEQAAAQEAARVAEQPDAARTLAKQEAAPAAAADAADAAVRVADLTPNKIVKQKVFNVLFPSLARELRGGAAGAGAGAGAGVGADNIRKLFDALDYIYDNNTTVSKQGKTVNLIPKSDEIIARAAAVVQNGPLVGAAKFDDTFRGNAYKSISQSTFDMMKSIFNMDVEKASKWDKLIDDLYERLSNAPGVVSGADAIPLKNRLVQPWRNTANAFSTYSAKLQEGVRRARTPPTQNAQAVLRTLVVAERPRGFAGGAQRGGHAPLYPKTVMNGGAQPLAVINRGDVNPTAVLKAKIDQLAAQYKALTGQALPMLNDINAYKDLVDANLKSVNDSLQTLANANAAIAQYPLALGTAVPGNLPQLKAYADRALELNKASMKASRKLDRLVEMKDLIQDIVNKQGPAKLNVFPY